MTGHVQCRQLSPIHQRSLCGHVVEVRTVEGRTIQASGVGRCAQDLVAIFAALRRDEPTAATVAPPVISAFDTQIGGLDSG